MKVARWLAALCIGALAFNSCNTTQENIIPAEAEEPTRAYVEPGVVFVELTEEMASRVEQGESIEFPGLKTIERRIPDAGEWEARHREAGLHLLYKVTFDPDLPSTKAADDILNIPGVVNSEPVRRKKLNTYYDDPYLYKQWALYNDGTLGASYKAGFDINVIPVWDRYCSGNSNVIVAVLDTGVQLDHEDLATIMLPAGNGGSKCFIQGYVGYNLEPGDHGTHCSGIIGAINNNGIGISGIAGGNGKEPGVRIMSCEMLRSAEDPENQGETITLGGDDVAAFVWAADHGAVIASCSWGYDFETEEDAARGGIGSTKTGVDYFTRYAGCDKNGKQLADSPMKGGLVFFAAGNESWKHAWPAAYDGVIAVGSVGANGARAYYSNYGEWVDICAPGGDTQAGPGILSTVVGNEYLEFQGTSMACPHAAGVAALIVSYYGGQGFTNTMLKKKLLEGASREKAPKNAMIGPMIDVLGSFSVGDTVAPDPVPSFESVSVNSNSVTLTWKVTDDPGNVKAYSYLLVCSKDRSAIEHLSAISIPSSAKTAVVKVDSQRVGENISYTFDALEFDSDYYFTAIAYDYAGNYSRNSEVAQATTGINHAPVISTDYTGDFVLKYHETLRSIDFKIEDPDGHNVLVSVEKGSEAFYYKRTSTGINVTITGSSAGQAGKYTAKITATDTFGLSEEYVINYEILPNHAPAVISKVDNLTINSGESVSLDLSKIISDEDEEQLYYSVSCNPENVVKVSTSGSSCQLSASQIGLTTVTVKAVDGLKESCTLSFKALVPDSSQPFSLYPNPVKDTLRVRPLNAGSYSISISNKAGSTVYTTTADIDPFEPLEINLKDKPSGIYAIRINGSGVDKTYNIAKL